MGFRNLRTQIENFEPSEFLIMRVYIESQKIDMTICSQHSVREGTVSLVGGASNLQTVPTKLGMQQIVIPHGEHKNGPMQQTH